MRAFLLKTNKGVKYLICRIRWLSSFFFKVWGHTRGHCEPSSLIERWRETEPNYARMWSLPELRHLPCGHFLLWGSFPTASPPYRCYRSNWIDSGGRGTRNELPTGPEVWLHARITPAAFQFPQASKRYEILELSTIRTVARDGRVVIFLYHWPNKWFILFWNTNIQCHRNAEYRQIEMDTTYVFLAEYWVEEDFRHAD